MPSCVCLIVKTKHGRQRGKNEWHNVLFSTQMDFFVWFVILYVYFYKISVKSNNLIFVLTSIKIYWMWCLSFFFTSHLFEKLSFFFPKYLPLISTCAEDTLSTFEMCDHAIAMMHLQFVPTAFIFACSCWKGTKGRKAKSRNLHLQDFQWRRTKLSFAWTGNCTSPVFICI